MDNNEIKSEKVKMYLQIQFAERRLKEIRSICKHEKTFIGDYSYRMGHVSPAKICEYCGEFIKYVKEETK